MTSPTPTSPPPPSKAATAKTLWAYVDAANADVAAKALALQSARGVYESAIFALDAAKENAKKLTEAARSVDDVVKAEAGGKP